jgi:hypothetical protein
LPGLVLGLIASALLYLAAIYAFVWTGERRMRWAAERGIQLTPAPKFPSAAEIWRRHSVEMTVIYLAVFVLLALMDFTIWARLGFAAIGALVFGSIWFANSIEGLDLPRSSSVAKVGSNLGYWSLAVLDWFGYMSLLCFAAAVALEIL